MWGSEGRMTSQLVGSPWSSLSTEALPEYVWIQQIFLSSSLVECGSSIRILWIPTDSQLLSASGVSVSRLVRIPTTFPRSGRFANRSKSFIRFSYVICAFTYHIVELVFVLSYIQSRVWGLIEYIGTWCGDYYSIPQRLTTLIRRKIIDSAVHEVSEALSMHVAPSAIQIIVVPIGVTVLLGLCNPPHSWTDTLSPSLPGFTIAPCVDWLLCYRLIRRPKSILQDSPKIKGTCMHLYNCIWVVLLVPRLNLAFLSPKLSHNIDIVLVHLCPCGFDNPRNTLRWKLLQLASVRLRIDLFGWRTANSGADGSYLNYCCALSPPSRDEWLWFCVIYAPVDRWAEDSVHESMDIFHRFSCRKINP
jgi:hypothetical protein